MLTLFFYILSLAGIAILAILTYTKRTDRSSVYFSLLSFALAIWLLIQFVAIRIPSSALQFTILGLIAFSFIPVLCLLFTIEFIGGVRWSRTFTNIMAALFTLFLILLSIAPGTITKVDVVDGALVINTGIGYTIQSAMAVILVLLSIFLFSVNFKKFNQTKRSATYYLMAGILIAVVGNLISGYIFSNQQNVQFIGPLSLFAMSFLVTYAISKHKLFDIKFIVVRTLAYVLSLTSLGVISFLALSYLSNFLNANSVSESLQRSLFVVLTIGLAVIFRPFKRMFDKLTNKLFYRDAYETQDFLNEFNETIVSTIDLQQLLERAGATIEKYVKSDTSAFAIRNSKDDTIRLISAEDNKLSKEAVEQVRGYVHKASEKLFVTDALEEQEQDLKMLLQEANIGMLVRITTDATVEGSGYIILGYKKSGNTYNSQDTGAMEIVANELAIAIQNALQFDEIQKFAVTLQETVDEKTRQLRKSNEKLKQMDETKDEFISMASHQLRTPLTSVKGYVSMVIEGDAGELNEMQKKLLDQAFVSSQRMVYLIADLLNVSRLRTGKFVIDAIPSNLADVVQGEVEQLVETAASRGLELTFDKPKEFPQLLLDETKVRQVIMNFIDNAIYYTPSGGHIKVALKDTGSTIEYTVTDDGLGVPKSQQHHLFSKFFRADNAKKARPDGTGLGLFMAKKVIVAQGGSIIFKSTEGKGSTFGFVFDKTKLAIPEGYEMPEPLNGIKAGPGSSKN